MPKIIADRIYDEYDHKYFYEKRYETNIIPHLRRVFQDYYVYKFNPNIINLYNTEIVKTPDILMIRKDFEEWIIVEVEKRDHSINHILSQVDTFQNGDYQELEFQEYARRKCEEFQDVNTRRFIRLANKKPPIILVIVNGYKEDWFNAFRNRGIRFMVMEIYKDFQFAFRIDGTLPFIYEKKVKCSFEVESDLLLRVHRQDFLPNNKRKIKIEFSGRTAEWQVRRFDNKLYLEPNFFHRLDLTAEYKLYNKDELFYLVKE